MQRFRSILAHVNLARSDHPALLRAVRLARENNAMLTAISVIEEHPAQARAVLRSLHSEGKLGLLEQESRDQLEKIVRPIRDDGIEVDTVVVTGSTFLEIIRAALRGRHDLVIKTVQPEGLYHRTFFGSTDMHLLRKCPTPLWLIKADEPETFRRILVALDPNMEESIRHALGVNLLKLGTSLANMDGAELMVVHAWRPYAEEKLKKHMERKSFEHYVNAWAQESSNRTQRFIAKFERAIHPSSVHLVPGEPGAVIPEFVKSRNIDLVVMGTLGELGRHGLFIGDTAERILNRIECSVLAVKPAGFVSPVR